MAEEAKRAFPKVEKHSGQHLFIGHDTYVAMTRSIDAILLLREARARGMCTLPRQWRHWGFARRCVLRSPLTRTAHIAPSASQLGVRVVPDNIHTLLDESFFSVRAPWVERCAKLSAS
jgi:hypothetical protein